ncbi:MAG: hypothetical protein CMN96_04345 [Synechococcus sp. MED850]|nr:hypothetical protein [Synechococcus sp. MED850]OUW98477.1 MAG: hypothetical protein CBD89_03065 [Cyanobacteria bacterium TMED229]
MTNHARHFKHPKGSAANQAMQRNQTLDRRLRSFEPKSTGWWDANHQAIHNQLKTRQIIVHHPPTESLVEAIKLSVTPVFLLVGISSIMGILTTRFSRTVDRYEGLATKSVDDTTDGQSSTLLVDLKTLKKRLFLLLRAIQLLTLGLMGTALVVTLIFVASLTFIDLTHITAVLFFLVMALIASAAMLFLREIQLAVIQTNRFTDLKRSFRSSG